MSKHTWKPRKPWPPIHYDRRQVAFMVAVAFRLNSGFVRAVGENITRINCMIIGLIPPTPAVLQYFDLEVDGAGYVWHPR